MNDTDKLKILQIAVEIYRGTKDKVLILDKISDCSYQVNYSQVCGILNNIFDEIDNDVKNFILNTDPESASLAIIKSEELTDWHKVPQDATKLSINLFME